MQRKNSLHMHFKNKRFFSYFKTTMSILPAMEKITTCTCSSDTRTLHACTVGYQCKLLSIKMYSLRVWKIPAACIFVMVKISGVVLLSLIFPGFWVDRETALPGFGIFTDQPGNTSWLMLAKDFQSMSHKNMLALSVNP